MCGITGVFQRDALTAETLQSLQAANEVIRHRGPDGSGFALFNTHLQTLTLLEHGDTLPQGCEGHQVTLGLGHRRLSILDLSTSGAQPMGSVDGKSWITYNGEVYNYLELRSELESMGFRFRSGTDTEVILAAYQHWGEEAVSRLNGMWAFAIVDLKNEKLFCARDRFGIKPFHYFHDGKHFAFGSEIKQLFRFPFVSKRLNERALYEFLALQAVEYDEETFFAGVRKLLQGCTLSLDLRSGRLTTSRYYAPKLSIDETASAAESAAEYRRLFTDSVRLRLRSDVEVGSCLSGGLDSSSIVCTMHQLLRQAGKSDIQRTFSSHFDEAEANEREYMEEVIGATGVTAHFTRPKPEELLEDLDRIVWHQEEPFGSSSIFAQWSVFRLAHENKVKVMLDGQGADEQLAGYFGLEPYFLSELRAKSGTLKSLWEHWCIRRLRGELVLQSLAAYAARRVRRLTMRGHKPRSPVAETWINASLERRYKDDSHYLANQNIRPFGDTDVLSNVLYQLTFYNNLQSLLKYQDRSSMAFSVEARVPFLDYRLVEFVFRSPSNLKIRQGYTKRILRDAMAGIVPEKIRWRVSKLGFATPERTWRKTSLRPLIETAVMSDRLRPYLDARPALDYYERLNRRDLADFAPWRWVSLNEWMKVYDIG